MACAKNGVVGNNSAIPWCYPEEFRHFQNTIGNHTIALGRKSFELIPESILKNRTSIVFSRAKKKNLENIIFVSSLDEFFDLDILTRVSKVFMVGGSELVNYFLGHNLISEFILTKIKHPYVGDAILNIKTFDSWKSEVINKTANYDIYKLAIE